MYRPHFDAVQRPDRKLADVVVVNEEDAAADMGALVRTLGGEARHGEWWRRCTGKRDCVCVVWCVCVFRRARSEADPRRRRGASVDGWTSLRRRRPPEWLKQRARQKAIEITLTPSFSFPTSQFAKKKAKKKGKKTKKTKKTEAEKMESATQGVTDPAELRKLAAADKKHKADIFNKESVTAGEWAEAEVVDTKTKKKASLFGNGRGKISTKVKVDAAQQQAEEHVDIYQKMAMEEAARALHTSMATAKITAAEEAAKAGSVQKVQQPTASMGWREKSELRARNSGKALSNQLSNTELFPNLDGSFSPAPAGEDGPAAAGAGSVWGQANMDMAVVDDEDEEEGKEEVEMWAPVEESDFDKDALLRKTELMVDELVENKDVMEAIQCIKDMKKPGNHERLCEIIFEKAFEYQSLNPKALPQLAKLLARMVSTRPALMSAEGMQKVLDGLEEFMDDFVMDFPKCKEAFAFIKDYLGKVGALPNLEVPDFQRCRRFKGQRRGRIFKVRSAHTRCVCVCVCARARVCCRER